MTFNRSNLLNHNTLYVLINIFVSAVGFGRSFLFMKWFDMRELGVISLVQTIVMFLGLFQLGLLNGGYRIFALDKADEQRSINNILFTYLGILTVFTLLFWTILCTTEIQIVISNELMLVALVCGLFTLLMNWLVNVLIGKRLIKNINQINAISASISLVLLPLVKIWGVYGAVISIAAQPLVFITITLLRHKELRPTALNFDLKLVKYILSFGFIPFLAGIFTVVNLQIERWSIAKMLGTDALGEFYLVFLYATLFVLIPTSLLNIFFPKAVYAYENNQMEQFKSIIKKHFMILAAYLIIVLLFTLLGLDFFVGLLFPAHLVGVKYVYYFLPGLLALALCDPMAIIFNSTVRLRPILWAGFFAVVINVILIFAAQHLEMINLTIMSWIKTIVNVFPFFVYLSYFLVTYKVIFKLK